MKVGTASFCNNNTDLNADVDTQALNAGPPGTDDALGTTDNINILLSRIKMEATTKFKPLLAVTLSNVETVGVSMIYLESALEHMAN